MEPCAKNSLARYVKVGETLSEKCVASYLLQIIPALEYLQSVSVIHHDIKPSNMLLHQDGTVKLSDFGFSVRGTECTETSGTPNFMAPELLSLTSDTKHTGMSDMWSLGVSIFSLLTGTAPFQTLTVKDTYRAILANTYQFPAHPCLSMEARDIIQSLLQIEPSSRATLDQIKNHPFILKHIDNNNSNNNISTITNNEHDVTTTSPAIYLKTDITCSE